jgi:hypothetical protein
MSEDVAKLIFASVMTISFAVWIVSLLKALRLGKPDQPSDPYATWDDAELGEFASETGTLTLHGDPHALSSAFVDALSQGQLGMFASVFKIKECDDGRVILKKVGPLLCNLPPGWYFTDADIHFERASQGTVDVNYRLGFARLVRRLRKIALGVILCVGLPILCIVGAVIWHFVIPSQNPAVRWQVLQTFQIVHVLWPPFLIVYFYSIGRRQSKAFIENSIASVEPAE